MSAAPVEFLKKDCTASWMVRVSAPVITRKGHMKSFQCATKSRMNTVAYTVLEMGMTILKKVLMGLAPSMEAASKSGHRQLRHQGISFLRPQVDPEPACGHFS